MQCELKWTVLKSDRQLLSCYARSVSFKLVCGDGDREGRVTDWVDLHLAAHVT